MAHFSTGGASSPDLELGLSLILCITVSCLLNPVVIHHNRQPPASLPKHMFKILAVANFVMAPYLGLAASSRILKPAESRWINITFHNVTFPGPHLGKMHEADVFDRTFGAFTWFLIAIPTFLTGVLTCVRYLQISFPLWPIQEHYVTGFITGYIIYIAAFNSMCVLTREIFWYAVVQTIWEEPEGAQNNYWTCPLYLAPCMAVEFLAIIASVLTVYELYKIRKGNFAHNAKKKNVRGTVKIFLENALNVLYIGLQMSVFVTFDDESDTNMPSSLTAWKLLSFSLLLPVWSCAVNPAIYMALTPKSVRLLRPYWQYVRRNVCNKMAPCLKLYGQSTKIIIQSTAVVAPFPGVQLVETANL